MNATANTHPAHEVRPANSWNADVSSISSNPTEAPAARRLLVFAPSFEPAVKAGGPARSLTNLVRAVAGDWVVDVVTRDRDLGDSVPFEGLSGRRVTRGLTTIYYLDEHSPRQWRTLIKRLAVNRYDMILLNSIWDSRFALGPAALAAARVLKGPVVLMPRGELEAGALALKSTKKRIAGPAFRTVYRRAVSVFGATSDSEATNITAWFRDRPVVTTTNNTPDTIPWGQPAQPSKSLRVVFLSRINPKKGLLPLLDGLHDVAHPIALHIVGPTEDMAYWEQCQNRIQGLPAHITVTHTPLASRDQIPSLLWNSDCMGFLTAGENYGHVIAEALQAGCPVITTPTTPWTAVIRDDGGEIVQNRDDPSQVAAAINHWATKTPEQLTAARHAARHAYQTFSSLAGPNTIELAATALTSGPGVRNSNGDDRLA